MGIIINIDHFTRFGNLKKELSINESELITGSEKLINSALNYRRGITYISTARCSDLNKENGCTACLQIIITDVPNELTWSCPKCGNKGIIQNWRRSPVYIKSLQNGIKKKKALNTELVLSAENFLLLKTLGSSKLDLSILLNSAVYTGSTYSMHIAEFDILRVFELIGDNSVRNPEKKNELLSLKNEIIESFYSANKTF